MELQVFENNLGKIRVKGDRENPLFCLKDICEALGLESVNKVANAIKAEFELGELDSASFDTGFGIKSLNMITESQLYFVLMRSDKPKAKPFRKWITTEVLPSIRQYGIYATPEKIEEVFYNPESMLKIFAHMKELKDKKEALQKQNQNLLQEKEANKKYVSYAKVIEETTNALLIGEWAKLLCNEHGVSVGQNRLFEWLRVKGYLMSVKGERYNHPYQKYIDNGYFCVKSLTYSNKDGTNQVFTTKITGKGQLALCPLVVEAFNKEAV